METLPYFLHINKNAGNTMREIILANHPGERVLDELVRWRHGATGRPKTVRSTDESVVKVVAEVQRRQHELDFVAINLPYGIHELLDRPVAYFTLLREPVARCISYWFFAYEHRHEHPMWSQMQEYDFDLHRLFADRVAYQFTNDQVRMVTGTDEPDPGEDEFRLACQMIEESYLMVGTVDRFDEALALLGHHFAWQALRYEKQMVGQKTETSILPRHAHAIFRDANEWDARLYEWLVTRYRPRRLDTARPVRRPAPAASEVGDREQDRHGGD